MTAILQFFDVYHYLSSLAVAIRLLQMSHIKCLIKNSSSLYYHPTINISDGGRQIRSRAKGSWIFQDDEWEKIK